jgi:hypothetical protein
LVAEAAKPLQMSEDPPTDVHIVNAEAVDVAAGETVALTQALAWHLHHDSPVGVRAGITAREDSGLPFVCADRDERGHFAVSRTSRTPRRVQPWTTEILPNDTPETARGVAETLASVLLNQFGVLSRLYL